MNLDIDIDVDIGISTNIEVRMDTGLGVNKYMHVSRHRNTEHIQSQKNFKIVSIKRVKSSSEMYTSLDVINIIKSKSFLVTKSSPSIHFRFWEAVGRAR